MPNIKAEINKHNRNTLEKAQQKHPDTQLFNCTNKKQCPLNGQCLTESIVYQANITANIPGCKKRVYLGVSEALFKVRYGNHKKSFIKQRQKRYRIIQGVLESKTTERNTHNKVESIKKIPPSTPTYNITSTIRDCQN